MVRGSKSMRCSKVPASPSRDRAIIQPCSTIISSMTRPPASVALQTAVYLRLGTPRLTSMVRHSSGRTLARRLRGGDLECIQELYAICCRDLMPDDRIAHEENYALS